MGREAVAETKNELGAARELMKEREVGLEQATNDTNKLLQAKMAAEAENAHMLKELQDLRQKMHKMKKSGLLRRIFKCYKKKKKKKNFYLEKKKKKKKKS